jgi:hypothetical protein
MDLQTEEMRAERSALSSRDPDDLARKIRQLAMDTWQGLSHPNPAVEVLASLKHRYEELISQTQEPRAAQINRWLLRGILVINARLHPDPSAVPPGHNAECERPKQTSTPRSECFEPRPVAPHTEMNSLESKPPIASRIHGRHSHTRI